MEIYSENDIVLNKKKNICVFCCDSKSRVGGLSIDFLLFVFYSYRIHVFAAHVTDVFYC